MTTRIQREKDFHDHSYEEKRRLPLDKYYAVTKGSQEYYRQFLLEHARGSSLLEYGCGLGDWARELARQGASVTGIDLSDTAISFAKETASREQLDIDFRVMDAEHLLFEDGSFDLICGTGILHHLDLPKAYGELARTLRPEGKAMFLEPLGHNIILNTYRRLTPRLRTVDEHPFRASDLELAHAYFGTVETRFFHLTSLLAFPFRSLSFFPGILKTLEAVDRGVFATLPFLRTQAWIVAVTMGKPKKSFSNEQGA